MKKILIPIIGILLAITVIGWQSKSYSQVNLPYPEIPEEGDANPHPCIQATANHIALMRAAWNQNLQTLLGQEKPASEMVDEAFEGMRTYRCWLDYLCEAVLFSTHATEDAVEGDGLSREHIDPIAGCAYPNDIEIPTLPNQKLQLISYCHVPEGTTPDIALADRLYSDCQEMVRREFTGPDPDAGDTSQAAELFRNQSPAYISLERALKSQSAKQKSRALTDKLAGIVRKMHVMHAHMIQLREYMENFDARLECVAVKCD